ncbi:MAG: DUF2480 family protein [Bacteroidetes bacterium]|nr:DUF2480 family protein [Bacteroidota bacterium]
MEIENKVQASGIITLDLEQYYTAGERIVIDLKENLFMGLILKEKEFREYIKNHDWQQYEGKLVAITCSADAIVPTWAYMLVASKLIGIAKEVVFGSLETLETVAILNKIREHIKPADFQGARIVIKGCSKIRITEAAYVAITNMLVPYAQSVMFGEPCSTVPVYKKAKQ